ncbi:MAG: ACT domain-containing protein [Pseudomonadota bacterium]
MTGGPVSDLRDMLAGMEPLLHELPYVFLPGELWTDYSVELTDSFATITEGGDSTHVFPLHEELEMTRGLPQFGRITLQVHSALEGVGLTAAVATALAEAGIACNVIAGFHHDHLFVPWSARENALSILQGLSQVARR